MKRVSICDNFVHGRLRTSSDTYTKALWSLTTATLATCHFRRSCSRLHCFGSSCSPSYKSLQAFCKVFGKVGAPLQIHFDARFLFAVACQEPSADMREIFDAFDAEHEGEPAPKLLPCDLARQIDVSAGHPNLPRPCLCKARPQAVCDRTLHVRPAALRSPGLGEDVVSECLDVDPLLETADLGAAVQSDSTVVHLVKLSNFQYDAGLASSVAFQ